MKLAIIIFLVATLAACGGGGADAVCVTDDCLNKANPESSVSYRLWVWKEEGGTQANYTDERYCELHCTASINYCTATGLAHIPQKNGTCK